MTNIAPRRKISRLSELASVNYYWPVFIFVVAFGACVGSFLNVVIYRLPGGHSLIWPGSRCPHCQHALRWWENIPVLAWFYLLGKCRHCGKTISFQYPLVEATCALLFALTFWSYYKSDLQIVYWGEPTETWPALLVHLILIASLLAATVIDARLYIIPLQIPWFATGTALLILPISAIWQPAIVEVAKVTQRSLLWGSVGGTIGLVVAMVLLWLRLLPRSFDEHEEQVGEAIAEVAEDDCNEEMPEEGAQEEDARIGEDAPDGEDAPAKLNDEETDEGQPEPVDNEERAVHDAILAYPHPRREVLKECLFLSPPILGAVAGFWLGAGGGPVHPSVEVLGGVLLGYLVGGFVVWATRIGGTLGFGKEAMGLGDVHLLAAIGAVIGPFDTIVVFFIAPFVGLFYTAVAYGLRKLVKGQVRVIPYGPYLSTVCVVMMIFRSPMGYLLEGLGIFL